MWMVRQMILGTRIAHGEWSAQAHKALKGKLFATDGHPPALKPLDDISRRPGRLRPVHQVGTLSHQDRKQYPGHPRGHGQQRRRSRPRQSRHRPDLSDMPPRVSAAILGALLILSLSSGCTNPSGSRTQPTPKITADTSPITHSSPYWCKIFPQQAIRKISGLTIPLEGEHRRRPHYPWGMHT